MLWWLLRRDILGVAGRASGSDVQQPGSASWVPFDRRTWRHLFQESTILAGDRRTQGEPFAPGAVEEQTTLIEHLLSLKPLQGVA